MKTNGKQMQTKLVLIDIWKKMLNILFFDCYIFHPLWKKKIFEVPNVKVT